MNNPRAEKTRQYLDSLSASVPDVKDAMAIAFVVLCEGGQIDEITAGEHAELFEEWRAGVDYAVGNLRMYNGQLHKCRQAHRSQAGWEPDVAVSLWAKAADPAEEWPEWSQPIAASDAYGDGARVSCDGKHWVSAVDNNVWRPGVYGWTEVT